MASQALAAAQRIGSTLVSHPEKLGRAVRAGADIATLVAKEPSQARLLGRWFATMRRGTVDLELPWLPFDVIDKLERYLADGGDVFEYGGGGSTLWFAAHATRVVTVEHHEGWFAELQAHTADLPNVTLLHGSDADGFRDYVAAIGAFPDESFDVVVVDGRERVRCVLEAMPKVRRGGWLILDDSDRERYAPAFEALRGWPRHTVRGLTPTKPCAGTTTILTKP